MICNKSQLADILGKTETTLTAWQKEGMPFAAKRGRSNSYDTAAVIEWMIARQLTKSAVATSPDELDANYERARKDREIANKYELANAQRRGELLEASDVEKAWAAIMHQIRTKLLAIPAKLAPVVVAIDEPSQAQEEITVAVHECLDALAEEPPEEIRL